jgi:tetrahedral aminopeptidase
MTHPSKTNAGAAMKDLIQKLVAVPGPSGYESKIRDFIKSEIEPHVSSLKVDALGNLIAVKGTKKPGGLRILFSAHMDEIGLVATHVDKHGFVRFTQIGGVSPLNCVATHVTFLNGVKGVINGDRREDLSKAPTLDQLFIDVGASSPEDCPVKVGEMGYFEHPFLTLGSRIVSKALDDRSGCAMLIELINQVGESPHELICVFSAQEEVGIRGAATAAFSSDPDLGIAIDVTGVGDTPGAQMEVGLGKGPAIKIRDEGMLSDPRVVALMKTCAEHSHLPYQLEILKRGTTDARAIQTTRAGIPTGCLSIPTRYIHSPSEMLDMNDLENGLALLLDLVRNPIELK